MDRVHEGVHGLGPQEWSMDRGSMFCIRPSVSPLRRTGRANDRVYPCRGSR